MHPTWRVYYPKNANWDYSQVTKIRNCILDRLFCTWSEEWSDWACYLLCVARRGMDLFTLIDYTPYKLSHRYPNVLRMMPGDDSPLELTMYF